ncbi:MAG: hypothetical protein M1370_04860 [Bacteroidetes bacterium]|nr:hypothetical protein [Bacteroidota bacterium]MCL5026858.1 hypothetical protein [Chloroflexota bacterium]
MDSERRNPPIEDVERLRAVKDQLEGRLVRGEQMIREAKEQGETERLARLERHWMDLLDEYESVCARLEELEGGDR